jgi:hypothetical protein
MLGSAKGVMFIMIADEPRFERGMWPSSVEQYCGWSSAPE